VDADANSHLLAECGRLLTAPLSRDLVEVIGSPEQSVLSPLD